MGSGHFVLIERCVTHQQPIATVLLKRDCIQGCILSGSSTQLILNSPSYQLGNLTKVYPFVSLCIPGIQVAGPNFPKSMRSVLLWRDCIQGCPLPVYPSLFLVSWKKMSMQWCILVCTMYPGTVVPIVSVLLGVSRGVLVYPSVSSESRHRRPNCPKSQDN